MNSPSANADLNNRCADVSEEEWWERVTGRGKEVRKRRDEAGGDRQRLGPTYNREHERAQNVPK